MKLRALWLIPLAVFVTAPALAVPSNPGAGQTLFDEGVKFRDLKQWADALNRFQRSNELQPSVGALINIGDCYDHLDKPASAWGAFKEAENLAVRTKDARAATAHDRANKMEPKVAHLTLTVPKIEGLTVTRSGTKIDPATFDTSVPIDHGSYTLEVTAPGRKASSTKVDIAPAASQTVTIPDLELVPGGEEGPKPKPPETDEGSSSTQRTVGIGLEIGGGAILAAGLVFGALTISSWSSAEKRCPDGACGSQEDKQASASAADQAGTFGAISTVAVILGAAALIGGVVLHLTAPKQKSAPVGSGTYGLSFAF